MKVGQGEVVRLKMPDCFANQISENSSLADFRKLDPKKMDGASGPIYVEGAEPGDTLEVGIEEVKTGPLGCSITEEHFGLLKDRFPDNLTIWEVHDGYAVSRSGLLKGIRVPVNAFLGIMGVAPGEGEFGMIPPQAFGGNMDNRLLTSGAKLFLPVQVPGALFSAGDPHAAQGDGESGGTGLEISATATLRFRAIKDMHIRYPRAIVNIDSRPHLLTMGISDESVHRFTARNGRDDRRIRQTRDFRRRGIHAVQPRRGSAHYWNRGRPKPRRLHGCADGRAPAKKLVFP